MKLTKRHAEFMAYGFMAVIVGIVFQQAATSLTEQGFASGTAYDNAAAYPKAVAFIVLVLVAVQIAFSVFTRADEGDVESLAIADLRRPAALLAVFVAYLAGLGWAGYYPATLAMLGAVMWLAGIRRFLEIALVSATLTFVLAFFFEALLKVVLPGGVLSLRMPW